MTDGNIEGEIHRFKNLDENELKMLYGEYQNRLKQIAEELRKRTNAGEIHELAIDIMKRHRHCETTFETDAELIFKKFNKDTNWTYNNRKVPNETLALCIVNDIYSKYNIEFNPHEFIEEYDLDGIQFQVLYMRLKDWSKENYWRR